MALPTTFKGSTIAIFLEDTGNPGTFLRPCGLNNHSYTFSKNTNETTVPDCDDPDLPAWIEREVESLDVAGSGSGILAAEALDNWWAAFASTDSINSRLYIGKPDNIANGRFWAGRLHINSFEVQGDRGQKAQLSVGFTSDGELVYTNVT